MAALSAPVAFQTPTRDIIFEGVHHGPSFSPKEVPRNSTALHLSPSVTSRPVKNQSKTVLEAAPELARSQWRPRYHIMAPSGWLNDPCAPGYDPIHDVYHVGFQWNPNAPEWGDIAWGSARSKDLMFWEIETTPSIDPSCAYEGEAGVFTGCMSPVTAEPGSCTTFYTSARILPIHHTLPYNWGSEAICMAHSTDAGRTWQRARETTVVSGPPSHLQVTGWRDPFVAAWPTLSRLLGGIADTDMFGIVSGGLRGEGPAVFIYSLDPDNLAAWSFRSVLTPSLGSLHSQTSKWTPDYGKNWEVVNFVSLPDPDDASLSYEVLIVGVEGRKQSQTTALDRRNHGEFRRDHSQMWLCGKLIKKTTGIEMQFHAGGMLDYGALYAANSFHDPKTSQQVTFGWIVEEDLSTDLKKQQGWCGLLSIPRVIRLQRLHRVVHALKSDLNSISSVEVQPANNWCDGESASSPHPEVYTVTTLCSVPDPRLKGLRQAKQSIGSWAYNMSTNTFEALKFPVGCETWEAEISFDIGGDEVRSIGFIINHGPDSYTTVSFNPQMEMLKIDRSNSTRVEGICVADEEAPHTLFSMLSANATSSAEPQITQEHLRLHLFYDVSSLELFANDRTAITTRIYPDTVAAPTSIQPFVIVKDGQRWTGRLLDCTAWEVKTSRS